MGTGRDLWNQLETLLNKPDVEGVAALFTSGAVYAAPAGRYEGREAITAFYDQSVKAMPDSNFTTSLVIEDGDTLVAEWTSTGTLTGPAHLPDGTEIAATGKTLELPGVSVCTITDGKFATMRDYYDMADLVNQLGLTAST